MLKNLFFSLKDNMHYRTRFLNQNNTKNLASVLNLFYHMYISVYILPAKKTEYLFFYIIHTFKYLKFDVCDDTYVNVLVHITLRRYLQILKNFRKCDQWKLLTRFHSIYSFSK